MNRLLQYLFEHWLIVALIAGVVVAMARSAWGGKPGRTLPAVCLLLCVGALAFPYLAIKPLSSWETAGWFVAGFVALFLLMGINLWVSGRWSRSFALALGAAVTFCLGGFAVEQIQRSGVTAVRTLRTLEFVQPGWLFLLVLVPAAFYFSRNSLAGLGPVRRWVAPALRCGLIAALALALAEPRLRRPNENVTVLFVVDRSFSVPQENDSESEGSVTDKRWLRVQKFINESVVNRGGLHRNDSAGAILFARRPRLVLPPGAVDRLIVTDALAGPMDANYTDIAAAIKLAVASFPEGTGKRIVLISDGNENLGNAEEQAAVAKQNGVQIDVLPLAQGYRHQNEVLVERVEAPAQAAKGARLPIRVQVRNAHPDRLVFGRIELMQNRDGRERPIAMVGRSDEEKSPYQVTLQPGQNTFTFRDRAESTKNDEELSYSYRAVFVPTGTSDRDGRNPVAGLVGDRIQNNRGLTHVIARGSRRVLFIEPEVDADGTYPHSFLIEQLRGAKFAVLPRYVSQLPPNKEEFVVFLSNFDCVIIGDVPAESFTAGQREAIRANTYDQGCGLVFVGGPNSYGAGGYQKTEIEAALPVDCEIKAMKAAGRGGLVLVMHASEMADGNKWQKEIAKLAIDRLSPIDMVGVLEYDGSARWHIPFQEVGNDKGRLKAMVDRLVPGDMMSFDPFIKAAYDKLSDPQYGLAVKHCIIISDGDPQLTGPGKNALADMKTAGITCSTVGVATHSAAEDTKMTEIAEGAAAGGRYYSVKNPNDLPSIYMRESRRVSQSFLYTQQFNPKLVLRSGPSDKLDPPLPDLHGFVRTTLKSSALAEMLIEGPKTFDQRFPILATWQYGLGRSAAFTSDARSKPGKQEGWDRKWAGSEVYLKFWESTVAWAMRGLETDRLVLTTEYREGKVFVVVDARDESNRPLTDLKLEGAASTPGSSTEGAKPITLKFEQRAGGRYEAEFKAEEAGTYIVNASAVRTKPLWKGRSRGNLPQTVEEKDGVLRMLDGTPVIKRGEGKFAYADDGTPVEEQNHREVIDSRRTGVSVSYSPEFSDVDTNSAMLQRLAALTGGNVYEESDTGLRELARAGTVFRSAPEGVRALAPLWYWLVFICAAGLLIDVAYRRISIEPSEVRSAAVGAWARLRKRRAAAEGRADEDAFMARLKQRKAGAAENIEREKAGRKFEVTGPPIDPAPAGADAEMTDAGPLLSSPPPVASPPPSTAKPADGADAVPDDYMSKLGRAKRRAPHERDRE